MFQNGFCLKKNVDDKDMSFKVMYGFINAAILQMKKGIISFKKSPP